MRVAGIDPYWPNVIALLHFDGADGSTVFVDETGSAWTRAGSSQISDAQSVFGGASLLSSGRIYNSTNRSSRAFGTGDFTIEFFVRFSSAPGSFGIVLDSRSSASEPKPTLFIDSSRRLNYFVLDAVRITSSALNLDQWYHIAIVRFSGSTKMYVDGVQAGSTWSDSTNYTQNFHAFGDSTYSPGSPMAGWVDEARITKGIARYTADFTVPAAPFPSS